MEAKNSWHLAWTSDAWCTRKQIDYRMGSCWKTTA
jgi:hypothetical protein